MNGNALGYLLRTKMRNQLKSFFQKPIRIIYIVIFLALIVLTVIGGNDGANESDRKLRDLSVCKLPIPGLDRLTRNKRKK